MVMDATCTAVVAPTAPSVSVKFSLASTMASRAMLTLIVLVSPAVPVKLSGLSVVTA